MANKCDLDQVKRKRCVFLYGVVDKYGNTIDFLLIKLRQKMSEQKFFNKVLGNNRKPRIVNIDKRGAIVQEFWQWTKEV